MACESRQIFLLQSSRLKTSSSSKGRNTEKEMASGEFQEMEVPGE